MQYRNLVLTLLIIVSECRDLTPASSTDSYGEVRGQTGSSGNADTRQEPGSSRVKPETSGDETKLREFLQIRRKLEEMETERPQNRRAFPVPGGRTESLMNQTRAHFVNLADLYLPSAELASPACQKDLMAIFLAMIDLENPLNEWAIYLVDSWGKFPDGLLMGNMKAYGFFHECLNIRVKQQDTSTQHKITSHQTQTVSSRPPHKSFNLDGFHNLLYPEKNVYDYQEGIQKKSWLQNPLMFAYERHKSVPVNMPADSLNFEARDSSNDTADFEGQYCLLSYTTNTSTTRLHTDGLRMPGLSVSIPMDGGALLLMAYGTCMPSSCTSSELQESVNGALEAEGLRVANVFCQTASTHHELHAPEIVGIVLVSVLSGLLLLATLADIVTSIQRWQHYRTGALMYLLTFSVPANITKLFYLDTKGSPRAISSIYGMRFMSILWVVLGHQYAYSLTFSQNLAELPKMTEPVLFQLIANADKTVDTFFLMSGLLVTVGLLTQVTKDGKFKPLLYYIHRIVRLLPPLALTVALIACLSGLVVSGPFAPALEPSLLRWCRHNWWMDVIMLTNLFLPHMAQLGPEYGGQTCIPHTWYVDVDMQLFIFMPLILLPLYYSPKLGRVWLGVVTLASVAIPSIIIGVDDLWPTSMVIANQSGSLEYNYKVYMMPWTRASPYLVGAWVGYAIFLARSNPSIAKLSAWQVWAGWGVSTGTALAVLLGIAEYNHVSLSHAVPEMSLTEAVFYGGLHRAAWAAAVGWVVLACHWGYGGPVNWILSHPLWQPLSRLTYTVYLTSLPVQQVIFYSMKRTTYYTNFIKVQETCGVMLVVLGVSLWVTLVSESPILRLEKLLLAPKGSQTKVTDQAEVSQVTTKIKGQTEVQITPGDS